MAIFVKDPAATIDYAIDWSAGYLNGQTITASVWRVEPAGSNALGVMGSSIGPEKTHVTLSGGMVGTVYRVSNAVVFSDSRSDERTLVVRVEER